MVSLLSKFLVSLFICVFLPACWQWDTHERPTFDDILKLLDDVAHSKFRQMPDDNFYDLQDDWKVEIDERLIEIRQKEKVSKKLLAFSVDHLPEPTQVIFRYKALLRACRHLLLVQGRAEVALLELDQQK